MAATIWTLLSIFVIAPLGALALDRPPFGDWIRRMQTPCAIAPFYGLLTWLNRDGRMFADASRSSWFISSVTACS